MWICRECGKLDTKEHWQETTQQMSLLNEQFVCPECGSHEVVSAAQCSRCSTWIAEEDICLVGTTPEGLTEVCQTCCDELVTEGGESVGETQ